MAELIRGKTGRVYGNLMALLTVMKGLPLAYNKDMQEDKELIFDSIDTAIDCIDIFGGMLDTATFKKQNMLKAAKLGFINATDCADYLTKKECRSGRHTISRVNSWRIVLKKAKPWTSSRLTS